MLLLTVVYLQEKQGKMSWANIKQIKFIILMSISCGLLYLHITFTHKVPHCTCGHCHVEKHHDAWFSERFNASYHPLMTRNSSHVSTETFLWWQHIQLRTAGWNEYRNAVDKLFQIIPDKELYMDGCPDCCRVCSVVGNSGNLKNSRYGPLIDFSDFILRINRGPTKGYERDVGSKTTHRIIYPESAVDVDNSTHLVMFPFKVLDLEWLISVFTTHTVKRANTPVKSTIKANLSLVSVVSPSFMKYVHYQWLQNHGLYPSTGFMTIVMALHICDKVRVFGFGADKNGNWDHYFEKTPPFYRTGGHGGTFEYATLKELHKRNKIEFYTRW
ncbi:hypothetical protein ACEWY4_022417 [Coilia grayii]|uniref:CMP-N-acetylneuraminate-beta-galactosamide-alpha-2,3-sialyltransferase 1 n=1 Tax=Coilia grayii TaxID=363190 RepID=A0ABD1J708_9TELE